MKKLIKSKYIISALIIFSIIFGTISTSFAVEIVDDSYEPSKIVQEIIEKREESSKTFLCEDGTYLAVTYSEPVHYKDGDVWKEVDNSLILDAKKNYSPRSSGYSINLPESMAADKKIIAKNGDSTLSFSINLLENSNSSIIKAQKVSVEKLASNAIYKSNEKYDTPYNENKETSGIEEYNNRLTEVKNQKSALVYGNVFSGVDFEYVISSGSLKENIVINQPQDEYEYSFTIDFSGLTPITNSDGSISIMRDEEAAFVLSAPYMYDMNRAESVDVKMSLIENNDNYVLKISADSEWINSKERAFPVIIDPTVSIATNEISDVFVENLMYANSPRSNNELRVGKNLTNLTRTYIKTTLPNTIPYGSVINFANLTLYKDYYFQAWNQSDINIVACDCSSRPTWQADSVSWNDQPFSNAVDSYQYVSGCQIASIAATEAKTTYIFNVKTAAQKWLNTGTNKGIMLASSDENSKTQIDFHSTRVNESSNRPKMVVSYTVPGVSSSTWNASASASTSSSISVICNPTWTINTSNSWITYTNKTADSFEIKVSKNTGINNRTGTLQVTSNNHIIGTVEINQLGVTPSIITNTDTCCFASSGANAKTISITSNADWTLTKSDSWISISKTFGTENDVFSISVSDNTTHQIREGTVTVQAGEVSHSILVKQQDEISELFNEITADGTIVEKSSSEYIHPISKWAMELSSVAYNPLPENTLGNIPGSFITDNRKIYNVLVDEGFENIEQYHYDTSPFGTAAHSIAYKNIYGNNGTTKTLIVIVIRGTASIQEWLTDISSIVPWQNTGFNAAKNDVLNNFNSYLDLYEGEFEDECKILITGHSMGAAVANLLSGDLSSDNAWGESRVFGYTFASPNAAANISTSFTNIYNFLNRNDIVPLMPQLQHINYRGRHGIDINFMTTDNPNSIPDNHKMSTYLNWLNGLSNDTSIMDLLAEASNSATSGILPKILSVKCPVSVTIYDENDNPIAYESMAENNLEPQLSVGGVSSWITNEGRKMFFIPFGSNTQYAEISAYDYGSMTISEANIDGSMNNIEDEKAFNDVMLYPGKEFSIEISDEDNVEDLSLYVIEEGEIVGEITETNPMLKSVTVTDNNVTYGNATYISVTCDESITMIRWIKSDNPMYYIEFPLNPNVHTIVNNEDGSFTFIQGMYFVPGYDEYDISVKSGEDWYTYEKVFYINVLPENN